MANSNNISVSVNNNLDNIEDTLFNTIEERLTMATLELHGKTVETLSGGRSGKTYKVPATNQTWTASAPNEPPAVRLGDLRTSLNWKVIGNGYNAEGQVGSPLPYARRLEKGFVGVDRLGRRYNMQKRPYLKPTFEKNKKRIQRFFKGLL